MNTEANLTIIFCSYLNHPAFNKFILNGEEFKINIGTQITKTFIFDKYEQDLDKIFCKYQLVTNDERVCEGSFDISPGNHIAYCFIDDLGMTFKILFLQKEEKIKKFIKSNFTSSINSFNNFSYGKKEIKITLNKNDTQDRASMILINCLPNTQIKKDEKLLIDLAQVEKNIENMEEKVGYQICYHFDDFNKFVYQKMEEVEKFNFEDEYKNHFEVVDNLYSIYNRILENEDKNKTKGLISNFRSIYNKNSFELNLIIEKKYVYGKKILEEDLNKNCYFEFIFKILSLMLFNENISESLEDYGIKNLNDKYQKLLENKKKLDEDILLKIYEKIFLLIEVYSLELLYKDDYLINYYHIKNIEKNSPLFYAYEFLTKFIDELNYDSNLYYPLLSIDAGLYINYFKKKREMSLYQHMDLTCFP